MSDLGDAIRQFLGRFGRPDIGALVIDRDDRVDDRLTDLEREQREIDARLLRLEQQSRRD
jgi:hypothetical protein